MSVLRPLVLACAAVAAAANLPALAAEPAALQPTTIDLQASASRAAANDLVQASMYVEATDARPDEVARKVNELIAAALQRAKTFPAVKTRSGNSQSYPVYSSTGKRIEGWRMRSELLLESTDVAAISALVGQLQSSLALAGIQFIPRPETRDAASDAAALDAINAFRNRAAMIAKALDKPWRIRHLSVNQPSGFVPPMPKVRSMAMSADAAPMPAEAGESQIQVDVSGTIELLDKP